jgi:TetR/AcrR family transcriptional regulator, transcriptional repressor of bet genes
MPKVGVEDLRRRQLIAATITSIHEEGFANATISRISKTAGLSGGIVAHYFDDKAGLLAATMRSLAQDLLRETVKRLKAAETPEAPGPTASSISAASSRATPAAISRWATISSIPGANRWESARASGRGTIPSRSPAGSPRRRWPAATR